MLINGTFGANGGMMAYYGWHFTGEELRDGSPLPAVGEWEQYDGPCVMCERGLHVGKTPWDALRYSPGANLRYVEYEDVQGEQSDKILCRRRRPVRHGLRRACECPVVRRDAARAGRQGTAAGPGRHDGMAVEPAGDISG